VPEEALRGIRSTAMTVLTRQNPFECHGQTVVHGEFAARHSGHNVVLTKYVVERKQPSPPEPGPIRGPSSELVVGH
jgi:hypothetical protein